MKGIEVVCYFINQCLTLYFWEANFRPALEEQGHGDIGSLRGAVITSTMTSIRAFEDFCGNVMYKEDDIVTDCFPGLTLRSFLEAVDRKDINKRVPHITLSAFADYKGFNYKQHLKVCLPVALDFCRYAERQAVNDPAKLDLVKATAFSCDVVQRAYVLAPDLK